MKSKEAFKINGFTVVSNGLTYDDYKAMNNMSRYIVREDEYFVTNKRLKLFLHCYVDKENGVITINDDDYNELLELSKTKNLNKYRFLFQHIIDSFK